ncbi:MAG: PAS-domain containing protein [Rhizobiales bacterium]|nr:PAS-domain containing protein [Hyphomicrobiales bacterium]
MRTEWRAISGPVLITAISLAAIAADHAYGRVPNPAPLQVCIVAMAAALAGIGSGLVSAVIAVATNALFMRHHGPGAVFDVPELLRLGLLATTASATAVVTGLLRQKMRDAMTWERNRHATATRLASALDEIDIGVVLLDADTRAEFINRAFRKYFALPDAKADSKPPFIALMYHGRDAGCYELPKDELAHFISERIEKMRTGDSTPINIKLADGQVMRFQCTALPNGGRMLSYTPITDLIRRNDDPALAEYYRSLRAGGGDVFAPAHLHAAE